VVEGAEVGDAVPERGEGGRNEVVECDEINAGTNTVDV
jgi:hypothetical protein